VYILNYISGNNDILDAEPPKEHPSYDALNDTVRAAFALTIPALQRACRGEGDKWPDIKLPFPRVARRDIQFWSWF